MKFKTFAIVLSCFIASLIITQSSHAQMKRTMTFDADEPITIIAGLNAIIKGGDNGLTIEMIPPKDHRPKEYKDVDLANQDKIIMCNGKKLKTIEDLTAILDEIEVGGEISFGVKRGNEMMIVSFPKADPQASGGMMMMTTTIDDDGEHNESSMMMNGVEMKDIVMVEAGLIIKDVENQISILALLPDFEGIIEGEKPKQGDILISINGKKDLTSEDFNKIYNAVKIGESISMTFLRDSKKHTFSFNKPAVEDSGNEIIIKK